MEKNRVPTETHELAHMKEGPAEKCRFLASYQGTKLSYRLQMRHDASLIIHDGQIKSGRDCILNIKKGREKKTRICLGFKLRWILYIYMTQEACAYSAKSSFSLLLHSQ